MAELIMRHSFRLNDDIRTLWLSRPEGEYRLDIDGVEHQVAIAPDGAGNHQLTVDGIASDALVAIDGNTIYVHLEGRHWELTYLEPIDLYAGDSGTSAEDVATAPMPGVVIAVHVTPGARVTRGDTLMVIESMKLETAIKAWRDGTVETIHVPEGRTFERSAALVTFAPETKS
jgi:3-methylcrotonyl-CoA carboxylase alpha subunit